MIPKYLFHILSKKNEAQTADPTLSRLATQTRLLQKFGHCLQEFSVPLGEWLIFLFCPARRRSNLVTLFPGKCGVFVNLDHWKSWSVETQQKFKKTFQTALMERINKFWQSITLTHHLKGPVTVLGVHVSWRLHISAFDENYLVEWYSILDLLLLHGIMSLKVDSKKWENKLRIQGLISSSFSIEINLAGSSVHPNLNHLGFLRGFQLFAVYQPQLQDHVFCGRRIPIIF